MSSPSCAYELTYECNYSAWHKAPSTPHSSATLKHFSRKYIFSFPASRLRAPSLSFFNYVQKYGEKQKVRRGIARISFKHEENFRHEFCEQWSSHNSAQLSIWQYKPHFFHFPWYFSKILMQKVEFCWRAFFYYHDTNIVNARSRYCSLQPGWQKMKVKYLHTYSGKNVHIRIIFIV